MQDWVERLLAVQEMDLRRDLLREQIASVPGERENVIQILQEAQAESTALHDAIQIFEKDLKHHQIDSQAVRSRKADFQTKSTMIKSNEDYRAALHQIELCDRQIANLEDQELEIMERIEAARGKFRASKVKLAAATQRCEQMIADLDTRTANCQKQIDKLSAEREPLLSEIDVAVAKRYDRLRMSPARRNHPDRRALVPVRDGVCDRCRMNVTAQTRMNTRKSMAVACEHCGTLLYHNE